MTPDELADRMDEARLRVWIAAMNLEWWAAHVANCRSGSGHRSDDAYRRLTGDPTESATRARDFIPRP